MSNLSILERIEAQLTALEKGEIDIHYFVRFLDAGIEALEGVPYDQVQRSRDLQYKVEVAGFGDEDESIAPLPAVIAEIREWIRALRAKSGAF